jgi:Flp pilus assembly protein TadD
MTRSIVRIAALALCATALSACGSIGLGGDDNRAITAPAASNTPIPAPGADLTAMLAQEQALRQSGDLTGAMHMISQLMLAEPDDPRVVGEYGKLLVQQNRPGDAIAFLNRAIQLSPNDWSLYSALGVANDQASDRGNARLAYEHALALKPNEPAVLNNYAMSRMLAGDPVQARALLARAQANGGTDPKILQNVALLDSTAPVAAAPAPATVAGPAPADHTGFPVAPAKPVTHSNGVASNALPPTAPAGAHAPTPLVPAKPNSQVVMQDVPVDPLAGPVGSHHGKPAKPSRLARDNKHSDHHVASNAPAKPAAAPAKPDKKVAANAPAKPAKPAKSGPPSLRMTADAGKP